jgi:hypothetical protein
MQLLYALSILASLPPATAVRENVSPIEKVLQLLAELESKVIKEGEEQQKIYEELADWCKSTSKETQFELITENKGKERAESLLEDSTSEITELTTKIEELTSMLSEKEADLKKATAIRKEENAIFLEADKELADTISMLRRAIMILEKAQSGSFLQAGAQVSKALQTLVDASALNDMDKTKLQVLAQASAEDGSEASGTDGGTIVEVMEDMLEKSEAQQADGQKAEMEAAHAYSLLKLSLEDMMKAANKELATSKKQKAIASEKQSTAEGDVERSKKEISADTKKLKDLQRECMTKAEEFESAQSERSGELEALATAKKILKEKTGGAAKRAYDLLEEESPALVQVSVRDTRRDQVVGLLQELSKTVQARGLSELAVKVRSAMLTEADPFAKVKEMITEMVEKLMKEAAEEAEKKAFCDKEMSETKAKREDKTSETEDLQMKIDKAAAKIAKLKEGVSVLEEELGKMAGEVKEATEMREKEKTAWSLAKADYEQGLEGIQAALQVLRDYYASKKDDDASLVQSDLGRDMSLAQTETHEPSGIIGMLEVAESDFTKLLAEGNADEDVAQKDYDKFMEDNKVATAAKETEVKYKGMDAKETKAYLETTKADLQTAQTELGAILEYWEKLQPECVAKPEPYEERVKRREKEIAGLKEALSILAAESGGDTAFLAVRRSAAAR